MSDSNKQLIEHFYAAFANTDAKEMAGCYHEDIHFSDPIFPDLKGKSAGNMWTMLCERSADVEVESSQISASGDSGKAHWDATYTFSATGREVQNKIDAEFEFRDGLIIRHRDSFDLWKWTRMALGPIGVVLGWSPIVKNKVRAQAAKELVLWEKKNG